MPVNQPQHHQSAPHKIRNTTLSAVSILILITLGLLSLRQYRQLQIFRQRQQQQQADQSQLAVRLISQMDQLQKKLNAQNQRSPEVLQQVQKSEDIIAQVAGGICLIQGEYRFIDPVNGKPLRYLKSGQAENFSELSESDETFFPISVTGQGRVLTVQYTGTGFLIDASGTILTNSHVTLPWKNADDYKHILTAGYEPELVLFQALFPNQPKPFALTVMNRSQQNDVALLHANLGSARIPVLSCASDPNALRMGETVLVIGYPTGFDALLARLDFEQMESVLGDDGMTFADMGRKMAQQQLIWPISTRGMCSQVSGGKIVYDAQTAIGGSGAPVIGSNGQVVAINTALMKSFSGSNFGIAINRGMELMNRPFDTSLARLTHQSQIETNP